MSDDVNAARGADTRKVRRLMPQPLTASAFAPFGDVIQTRDRFETINAGTTRHFADLARIEVTERGGRPRVSLYRVTPYSLPMPIRMLERHPLGSQLFMPLRAEPFLVVVARAGERVAAEDVTAFIAGGGQGINYHRGTWHHPVIALRPDSAFLVLDRSGPEPNCDEVEFATGELVLDPPAG